MEGTKHLTPRYSQMALGLADDILGPILADGSNRILFRSAAVFPAQKVSLLKRCGKPPTGA